MNLRMGQLSFGERGEGTADASSCKGTSHGRKANSPGAGLGARNEIDAPITGWTRILNAPCARRSPSRIGLDLLLCVSIAHGLAADTYPRQPGVDALHYVFRLTITDLNDEIAGKSTVTLRFSSADVKEVALDLVKAARRQGHDRAAVTCGETPAPFTHDADRLRITLTPPPAAGE